MHTHTTPGARKCEALKGTRASHSSAQLVICGGMLAFRTLCKPIGRTRGFVEERQLPAVSHRRPV